MRSASIKTRSIATGLPIAAIRSKRFVVGLKTRAPDRFDVLEFLPGSPVAQVMRIEHGTGTIFSRKFPP